MGQNMRKVESKEYKLFWESLYYMDKCFFYRDSLGLIKHYLKRHKHLFDVKTYNDLMYYVERKYDDEIPVKSN